MSGALARLVDRTWLQATDDHDPDGQPPELIYKLGFLDALQVVAVALAVGDDEVRDAITEAVALGADK